MEANPGTGRRIVRAVRLGALYPGTALRTLVLLLVVSRRLRRHGYARTVDGLDTWLGRASAHARSADLVEDEARRRATDLASVVRLMARVVPDATCLRQALVLRHLLGRSGIPSEVVLGVRQAPDGAMAFHAWLTAHGEVVSEPARLIDGFVVLDSGRPPSDISL